jgi:hypothetical protein
MSALFASHSIENVNLSPYGKSASQNTFSFKLILFSPISDTSIISEKSLAKGLSFIFLMIIQISFCTSKSSSLT